MNIEDVKTTGIVNAMGYLINFNLKKCLNLSCGSNHDEHNGCTHHI